MAITNEESILSDRDFEGKNLKRGKQTLKSNDILAIRGLLHF